jgi:two-component system chemotaxis response regulator CheB
MAASTGGPPALARVLADLGGVDAAVLIVQHIHPDFLAGFVAWLSRLSALPVKAGRAGERVKSGTVYVAPGGTHMRLHHDNVLSLNAEPAHLHTPSADELFASVASAAGAQSVGVLLTGMGADGADGLLAIRQAGGMTIVQDKETSAVFGMPQAAIRNGAARQTVPLDRVAAAILHAVPSHRQAAR